MHENLEVQRRVLIIAFRRYIVADIALEMARSSAARWFPDAPARSTALIGNPGSKIRRLYERHERALARLELARRALREAERSLRSQTNRPLRLVDLR